MRYYRMVIAKKSAEERGDTSTRKTYISKRQGEAPSGWVCLGVCGYFEKPKEANR